LHGWSQQRYQKYQCQSCGHTFHRAELIGMYTVTMVEYAAYMYLRSLSFNQVIAILGAYYQQDVFTKDRLIDHIERLSDRIPDSQKITRWLKPKRSGYYALDGTWLKYRGRDIVLLILFDVVSLDVVNYLVALEETEAAYTKLLTQTLDEISQVNKGFFCDGDPGLLKAVKGHFPNTPIQLCVFHKYTRVQQLVPFVRPKTQLDKQIKEHVQRVLFASSKQTALEELHELERFAKEHEGYHKLKQVLGVLKRNFDLLMTHFDHPEMSPYNNVLEGFNHVLKRRIRLMKGFKKPINIKRWLKLMLVDWRFHPLKETQFKSRRNQSPLQLAEVQLPKIYNWLSYVRVNYPKTN
jgi:transposase-like protein